jgi:choline dehydrogenase-like flavoprotein
MEAGTLVREEARESGWNFWNGSMVGGSSNLMSGYFHRMKPNDFRLKSEYGAIEGANVVDWPIDYAVLEPYYARVESVVGVSGRVVEHPFAEPRSTDDFPFPPTWEQPVAKWFDEACTRLGLHALPTPRAILPTDALGRKGCSYSNFCGSYGCATGAKGNARSALLDDALSSGNCEIIPGAFVYRLEHDDDSITAVHYYDAHHRSHRIEARTFVVAAQAIETSRLLLNSRSKSFPQGLANNSGQVGKNLIFSAGGTGQGRLLKSDHGEELMVRGAFVNRSLQEWYEYEFEGRRIKGGTIDFLYEHANPTPRALNELYDSDGKMVWGKALQQRLKHAFTESRIFKFEVFNDWLPTDGCYVHIDERVTDKWGMPVAAIRLNSHPQDLKVGEHLAKEAVKVLQQMGAKEISYAISEAPPANLVAGGCRFGTDPATSVLDLDCCAHEVSNLYVTDASFMPTGGSVPYTWTIYANAFRVADKILERLRDV